MKGSCISFMLHKKETKTIAILQCSFEQQQQELIAFYSHNTHTAFRSLMSFLFVCRLKQLV